MNFFGEKTLIFLFLFDVLLHEFGNHLPGFGMTIDRVFTVLTRQSKSSPGRELIPPPFYNPPFEKTPENRKAGEPESVRQATAPVHRQSLVNLQGR